MFIDTINIYETHCCKSLRGEFEQNDTSSLEWDPSLRYPI